MSRPTIPLHELRRPLGETIADLAAGLLEIAARTPGRTTGVEMTLPIELRLGAVHGELIGDLPLFRTTTVFDAPPAQLSIRLQETVP